MFFFFLFFLYFINFYFKVTYIFQNRVVTYSKYMLVGLVLSMVSFISGVKLCMNATIDSDLVKAVQQDLIALKNDVDKLAFEKEVERVQLNTELQNAVCDRKEWEQRVLKVEQKQELLTAKVQDQINEIKTEQVNVQRRVEHLEGQQCLTKPQICFGNV